jgi:hypothetical protein
MDKSISVRIRVETKMHYFVFAKMGKFRKISQNFVFRENFYKNEKRRFLRKFSQKSRAFSKKIFAKTKSIDFCELRILYYFL